MDNIIDHKTHLTMNTSFNPNMKIPTSIYTTPSLSPFIFTEHLQNPSTSTLSQLSYLCTLPGIEKVVGLPDIHSGYHFPIGSVSAFNTQSGIISPNGVGFDINCGVSSFATNIDLQDIYNIKEELASSLYNSIPICNNTNKFIDNNEFKYLLTEGAEYLQKKGIVSSTDNIESNGRMFANITLMSQSAIAHGINQLGTLGSGNHYLEIQAVTHIYDQQAAALMDITKKNQLIITVHTGSRKLGHKVCEKYLQYKDIPINSELSKNYLSEMGCAANYAFANRAIIGKSASNTILSLLPRFKSNLIYDVCHNIAKMEYHNFDNEIREVMVHRKGASRALPAYHSDVPIKYESIGHPVLVGGSMGTSSYIFVGTESGMKNCIGSMCHGAGRKYARSVATKMYNVSEIREDLMNKEIILKCSSEKGIKEEAPGAYKDMDELADYCESVGIARKICRVKPVIVIKG